MIGGGEDREVEELNITLKVFSFFAYFHRIKSTCHKIYHWKVHNPADCGLFSML